MNDEYYDLPKNLEYCVKRALNREVYMRRAEEALKLGKETEDENKN